MYICLFFVYLYLYIYIYIHSVHKCFSSLPKMRNWNQQQGWCQCTPRPRKLRHQQEELQVQREYLHVCLEPWLRHGKVTGENMEICLAQSQWWHLISFGKKRTHESQLHLEEAFSSCHDDIPQQFSHPLRCIWRSMWNGRKGKSTPATASHLLTYRLRWGTAGATGSCFWISCRKDGWNGAFEFKYLHLLEANPY